MNKIVSFIYVGLSVIYKKDCPLNPKPVPTALKKADEILSSVYCIYFAVCTMF